MANDALTIELDESLAKGLRVAAQAAGVPVAGLVRELLMRGLADEAVLGEDLDPEIDQRLIDDAVGQEATISWSRLKPWLESWGKLGELPPPEWRK